MSNRYKIHQVTNIYDGDTMRVWYWLSPWLIQVEKLRLAHVDAPEMRGPEKAEGTKTRNAVRRWIAERENQLTLITALERGKYGRLIGDLEDDAGDRLSNFVRACGP